MTLFIQALCMLPFFILCVVAYKRHRAAQKERQEQAKHAELLKIMKRQLRDATTPPIWVNSDNFSTDDPPITVQFPLRSNNPPAYKEDDDDEVDEDDDRLEALIERMLGETYSITYRDADGNYTDRDITVNDISHYGRAVYIDAYCHLREDDREFKISRILGSLINTRTGEGIDPDDLK
jgi:hypothetical protein